MHILGRSCRHFGGYYVLLLSGRVRLYHGRGVSHSVTGQLVRKSSSVARHTKSGRIRAISPVARIPLDNKSKEKPRLKAALETSAGGYSGIRG